MKKTIDSYIDSFSAEEKGILEDLRRIIRSVAPFEEAISYGMPAFRYNGKIVACFRMHSKHVGFYPYSGSVLGKFPAELKKFKASAGAVQFPKGKRLPKTLIRKLVRARMKEIDDSNK